MPWLLWGFDRQSYPDRELIVVDSSAEPWPVRRGDIRVLSVPPGTNVPTKRNLALEQARGSLVAWFDDDDWQHPDRLALLIDAIGFTGSNREPPKDGPLVVVGSCKSWFVDLHAEVCRAYDGHGALIFNTALYRTEVARAVRFDAKCRRASDTPWLRELRQRHGSRLLRLDHDHLMFWLCHEQNISNPRTKRQFNSSLEQLRERIAPGAWGDTDLELARLRAALPQASMPDDEPVRPYSRPVLGIGPTPMRRTLSARLVEPPGRRRQMLTEVPSDPPPEMLRSGPLSSSIRTEPQRTSQLVIVCTSASAESARALLPHWERQTSMNSALLESDPPYQLDALLQHLKSSTAQYTLIVRPRVLFHARSSCWVSEAEHIMAKDPSVELVTTHPGPPTGPLGTSRSVRSGRNLTWEPHRGAFRWTQLPSSYFLVRRQRLASLLEECRSVHLDELLAQWASKNVTALALAIKGSWSIERAQDFTHADLAWVLNMARRVEQGILPHEQRGFWQLRSSTAA